MRLKKNKAKKESSRRVQGDSIWFFFVHNSISLLIFFSVVLRLGLLARQTESLTDLISWSYLELVLTLFGIAFLSGIIGRILGFVILKLIFRKKAIKTFGEYNQGVNKISFSFLISTLISSILFSIGATYILQRTIFNEETLLTLIASYIIIKFSVFLFTRMFTEFKL